MDKAGRGAISVKPAAEAAYNVEIQRRLRETAWDKIDASWYKDGEKITNNWPGSSREFKQRLTNPVFGHFSVSEG